MGLVPSEEEEETPELPLSTMGGYNKKPAVSKAGRRPSPRIKSASTWV